MSLATKSPTTTNIRKSLLLSTTAIALCGMLAVNEAHADPVGANDLPQGHSTTDSSTSFDYAASGNRLDVKQGQDRIIVDWDSFNIGQKAKVNFDQPNTSSIAVNRVNGNTDPTRIHGSLSANGRLVILDPNGVIFGRNSSVDVGGLIASTGNLKNDNDFLNGDNQFTIVDTDQNPSSRGVVNKGTITVGNGTLSENGLVAFVAPYVKNKGTINAKLGKVTLAAGKKVTVDLTGDQLISIAANSRLQEAIVNNNGQINAQGGEVTLSAYAAKGVVDNVINMNGKIQASGFEETKGGKIILKAKVDGAGSGKIRVAGKMQADGSRDIETSEAGKGGSIDINGETVTITKDAILRARGTYGDGGSINIGTENTQMTKEAIINNGAVLATQSRYSGNGGDIRIWARNKTVFNGHAKATATSGNGGSLYITNDGSYLGYNGTIDLVGSGNNGELTLKAENRLSLLGTPDPLYTNSSYVRTGSIGEALINSNVNLIGNSQIVTRGNDHIDFRNTSSQSGDLTVTTPWLELNKNKNVVMGDSHLTLNAHRIDLNAQILGADGISQLPLSQLTTTTALVQIMSNKASIQQGIDLLNDVDNVDPELRIHYDEYKENLLVNKSITMNGLNRNGKAPILMAEDTSQEVVHVGVGNVIFNNFDVRGNDAASGVQNGLLLQRRDKVTIQNSSFTGFQQGIGATGSTNLSVIDSVFTDNTTSLKLYNTTDATASGNIFSGKGINSGSRGIAATKGADISVSGNEFSDITGAVSFEDMGGLVSMTGNDIQNAQTGTTADNLDNFDFTGNTMTGVIHGLKAHKIANSLLVARNRIQGKLFSGQTGILVTDANNANIDDNTVSSFGQNGIHVSGNGTAKIEDNFVTLTGNDGIKVTGSTPPRHEVFEMTPAGSLKIVDNTVVGTLGDGIEVSDHNNALISGNKVTATGGDGIRLNDSHNAMLLRNMVAGTNKNGYFLNDSDNATLMLNTSRNAGRNGIKLENAHNANLFANLITNAGQGSGSGSDYGLFTHGTAFDGNGIMVLGSEGAHIAFNMIINPREDGIKVNNSGEGYGYGYGDGYGDGPMPSIASISERPGRSRNIRIKKNLILAAGDDGIDLTNVHNAQVSRNIIALAQNNGIEGEDISGSEFNRNFILQPGQNGIDIMDGNDLIIDQNLILASAGFFDGDSPIGRPEEGDLPGPVRSERGRSEDALYYEGGDLGYDGFEGLKTGIAVDDTDDVSITNNTVRDFGKGITLQDTDDAFIGGNQIHDSSLYGFAAEGAWNRDMTLADNNFVNNNTGAFFQSGIITLEGVNSFTGGETGMIFSPLPFFGEGDGDYYREPTAYISDVPGYPPFYGSALELTDNTLGETVFEGQTGNYVTLENGALFNPGTPTVINGIESTFDGVSGAELTTAELNQIEGKIRDYDDQRTLGQIFVGFVPQDDTIIDQEDVLRQINSLLGIGNNNARVTVTGLPRVPGVTPNLVNALNALQPATGGDGNGQSPEELDALQPAAGGNNDNEANCWNQVGKSIAGGNNGVSYSLGENPQDILSDMADCDI